MIVKLRSIDQPYVKPIRILLDGEDALYWYGYPLLVTITAPLMFPKWAWVIVP